MRTRLRREQAGAEVGQQRARIGVAQARGQRGRQQRRQRACGCRTCGACQRARQHPRQACQRTRGQRREPIPRRLRHLPPACRQMNISAQLWR